MQEQTPHILSEFDEALQLIKTRVINMASDCRMHLSMALEGLVENRLDLCNEVIAEDDNVDQQELDIDAITMEILTRFNPVASDLRFVISSMNISRSLERIGDHAVNIAKRTRKMIKNGATRDSSHLNELFDLAAEEINEAMLAYSDLDSERARRIKESDQKLDALYKKKFKQLSAFIEGDSEEKNQYIQLLFIARSLERIGDLAVNIGEDIVFIQSAEDIRHQG